MAHKCQLCNNDNANACCANCKAVYYCNRQCQVKDWKNHKIQCKNAQNTNDNQGNNIKNDQKNDNNNNFSFTLPKYNKDLIRIEEIENKGYGLIANVDIKKGTIIHSEKAMIVLPDYAKAKTKFYINQQFNLLSQKQKNIYKSLNKTKSQLSDELLSIFVNNSIEIPSRKSSAIFPLMCRVNHSCKCNTHCIWIEEYNEERLIALDDIKSNTEICVNYIGEPMELKKRMEILRDKWNITCSCEWCLNNNKSQKINGFISEYSILNNNLESMISRPLDGYKSSQRLIKIVSKYLNNNSFLLSKHNYDAAQFALGLQKWAEASYFLETSIKERKISYGNDVTISDDVMEKVKLLPNKFRAKFRKYDKNYKPKSIKNGKKLNSNSNNDNDDDKKLNDNDKDNVKNNVKNDKNNGKNKNKKSNNKTGGKSGGKAKNKHNRNKNKNNKNKNKNKKKKGRK